VAEPIEPTEDTFYALVNDELQYSIWPAFVDVPAGWTVAYGPEKRGSCLEYIEAHWTDMRPKSLVEQMRERIPTMEVSAP
jgi:MbtH protein